MKARSLKSLLIVLNFLIITSLSCTLFGTTPTQSVPPTAPPKQVDQSTPVVEKKTPEPTVPPKSGAIDNLDDVEKAVIQIEADGTFVDPEVGWQVDVGKYGTGFIIDPKGIAITNNHVVTGAALLKVWVPGSDKPKNAKVLGVSECSDLAVIDIDGEGYPYLEWYTGKLKVSTKVFAAGYPLADPNYTLTDGIISKESSDGETSWASVDSVVQHTAKINPGNSGGPLVNEQGQVVGVNYASVASLDMNFAIGYNEANAVIDELRAGKDVTSLGINGVAVSGQVGDYTITGVWVRSVASGSPADKAGLQPADIVYQMEGRTLADDGTMAAYCDILRSHDASDTMSITVIRFADLSLLEGQFNGRALEVTGYFGGGGGGNDTPTDVPSGYITVHDDSYTIEMDVPAAWNDVDGTGWYDGNDQIGVKIVASASVKNFNETWSEPGVAFYASDKIAQLGGYIQVLDVERDYFKKSCSFKERNQNYTISIYKGAYDLYTNCGGQGGPTFMVLSLVPADDSQAYQILILMPFFNDSDIDTLGQILSTFKVIGSF